MHFGAARAAVGPHRRRAVRVSAAALLLLVGVAARPAPARALEPDPLPSPLWWRNDAPPTLAEHPLLASRDAPALRTSTEWAPLYVGHDGSRLESASRRLVAWRGGGAARAGIELAARDASWRTAGAGDGLHTERPGSTRAALALAREGDRFGWGGAIVRDRGLTGLAAEARFGIGRAASAAVSWSRLPEEGRLAIGWDEGGVSARAGWIDQRVGWRIGLPVGAASIALEQHAVDRRARPLESRTGGDDDALVPTRAWRTSRIDASGGFRSARWKASLDYGEGREGLHLERDGAPYGSVGGKVFATLAAAEWLAPRAPLRLRVWSGRWAGSARGSVALWPFDPVALLAGTRRVAISSGSLRHAGLAVDRVLDGRSGIEGGLALTRLAPRATYATWQATLAGIGRDDVSSGEAGVVSALALGARLAAALERRSFGARIEVVQWAPVRVERFSREPGAPDGDGGGPATGGSASKADRGGTILRFAIRLGARTD